VALLEKRRYLNNRSGDFPQVILIVPSHVPNSADCTCMELYKRLARPRATRLPIHINTADQGEYQQGRLALINISPLYSPLHKETMTRDFLLQVFTTGQFPWTPNCKQYIIEAVFRQISMIFALKVVQQHRI
jgi:hypothetical protein